jgi:hypothetical protein
MVEATLSSLLILGVLMPRIFADVNSTSSGGTKPGCDICDLCSDIEAAGFSTPTYVECDGLGTNQVVGLLSQELISSARSSDEGTLGSLCAKYSTVAPNRGTTNYALFCSYDSDGKVEQKAELVPFPAKTVVHRATKARKSFSPAQAYFGIGEMTIGSELPADANGRK